MNAQLAVEQAARESYSRLVAYLAARSRDITVAEDALSDAFLAALETWPHTGVPDKPEAWLLTTARRKLIDGVRHARIETKALPALLAMTEEAEELAFSEIVFPDERLKLLFICAHPAIDIAARTPLMLQTALGLDASRIASAFVVQPSTMGQRLTRAKGKIRDARIAFELPEAKDLPQRLDAVLEAVYAAYGSGWDDVKGVDSRRKGLALEAIYLGRVLLKLMPDEPEIQGLLALMLYCEARHDARRTPDGEYTPLSEQDVGLWSIAEIEEAERYLNQAAQARRAGRFQLEAAIQSVHTQRKWTGHIDWENIAILYEGLVQIAPTIGVRVNQAAAVAEAYNAVSGFALLEAIPADAIRNYQPYWALAAHLFKRMQRLEEAKAAYNRAIELCEDLSMREFLERQVALI